MRVRLGVVTMLSPERMNSLMPDNASEGGCTDTIRIRQQLRSIKSCQVNLQANYGILDSLLMVPKCTTSPPKTPGVPLRGPEGPVALEICTHGSKW